jgi:hypothetical protein
MNKLYSIDVCTVGTFTVHDVDCPSYWRGSGVYDVDYDAYREGTIHVAACSLERALKVASKWFFAQNPDWCNSIDTVYYNPDSVVEKDDEEGGTYEEVFDYEFDEPVTARSLEIPACYTSELPVLTLQEKLYDLLDRMERNATIYSNYYKDKDERKSGFYDGQRVLINDIRYQLRK